MEERTTNIQTEVSLYPLRTHDTGRAVERFVRSLRCRNLDIRVGAMSTRISGDATAVFDALRDAFVGLAKGYEVVLTIKASNACPANDTVEQYDKRASTGGGSAAPNPDRGIA